ncbi:hypothetical protein AB0I28_28145 [Phytomonospora sp. NPDC050363]|uniref:hypothetical protein n=1 Tax=Phytomonospora sp. NPDC050363 TaxID=3155642 RepID=UPI0034063DFD
MATTATRPADPGDPYADPPRNWKRVGSLAGAWIAVWVVLAAIGWVVMQVPALTEDDARQGTNADPEATARAFFGQAYGRGDVDPTQAFVKEAPEGSCGAQGLPDPVALRAEWAALETQYGPEPPKLTKNAVSDADGRAVVRMTVDFGAVIGWDWELSLFEDGGWWICGYNRTEIPRPVPSGS